ncbi:MAG: nucleotidyl transferase AbiEii/AbiGii toxin family protein, partial [Pseudonocardiaceae bacterium]
DARRLRMTRFRDSREFGPTLDAAADRLAISPTAIEKDYWVSEVLRALAASSGGDFVFKGGTSLSKGYRIVERFSEDVDVLLLPGDRGRGAIDTLMKTMAASAAAGVDGTFTAVGDRETGRHRSYEIDYPAARESTPLIRTSVLLEMGIRGGPHPHETLPIGCLLGDALTGAGTDLTEFADLAPFEVAVLHPGRTLLEKLVLIHALAQQLGADSSTTIPARNGRHFYDVYQLLGDDHVTEFLDGRDQVNEVMASVEEISRRFFRGSEQVRPTEGFAACPAFDPESPESALFRAGYETTMPELYFGVTPLPTWEAMCARVAEARDLL